uniref:Serine_rich domain-containing protein n=1 Tax=Macrostomum lignano TaxID=282301 RepID=A0A1I8IVR8_9PLAT
FASPDLRTRRLLLRRRWRRRPRQPPDDPAGFQLRRPRQQLLQRPRQRQRRHCRGNRPQQPQRRTSGGGKSVRFDDQQQPIYAEVLKRPSEKPIVDDPEPYDDPERLKRQISDTYDELPDVPSAIVVDPSPTSSEEISLRQKQQPQLPPPPPPPPPKSSRSDYQNLRDRVLPPPTQDASGSKHTITKEFLDSLLAPGSLESAQQRHQDDVEKRQRQSRDARSHTPTSLDSVASEDIQFRPECRIQLDQADAIRLLRDLERDFGERCARMYRFVHSRWKTEASLALNAAGIRLTLREARGFLDQLVDFFYGVLNNSRLESCPDRALARKLWKHLRAMEQSQAELGESVAQLDRISWSAKAVASAAAAVATDYLGISVSALRELQIQQRALSTTVQANATLLFPPLKQQQQQQ